MIARFAFILFFFISPLLWGKSYFPSVDDFQSLTSEKQQSLLRDLQSVFSEMAENSSYMAKLIQFNNNPNRLPANVNDLSDSERLQIRETAYLEAYDQLGISEEQFSEITRIATKTPMKDRETQGYKETYRKWKFVINHVNERLSKAHWDKYWAGEQAKKKAEEARLAELKKKEDADAEVRKKEHDAWVKEMTRDKSFKEHWDEFWAKRKRRKESQAALARFKEEERIKETEKAMAEFRKSEIAYINESEKKQDSVCMFAGWIIESGPCQGWRNLPQEYTEGPKKLNLGPNFDPKKMQCKKGEYICNPLLFGLVLPSGCESFLGVNKNTKKPCASEAKAVCATFYGGRPTQECILRSGKTLSTAVELITQVAPESFNQYRGSYFKLCDSEMLANNTAVNRHKNPEGLRRDIEETCKIAEQRLSFLTEKYFPERAVALAPAPAQSAPAQK